MGRAWLRRKATARGWAAVLLAGLCAAVLVYAAPWAPQHHHVVVVVARPARAGGAASAAAPDGRPAASAGTQPDRPTSSAPAPGDTNGARPGMRASFSRLEAGLPGRVVVSVREVGGASGQTFGADEPAHAWSTSKVPVLVALLAARHGGLTQAEQGWARAAITASDNQSILALFSDLEGIRGGLARASEAVQELFRRSGDDQTIVATAPPPPGAVTAFGQTEWSAQASARFLAALAGGCLIPSAQRDYVLGLMQQVVPSESWGLGSAGFAHVAFKGGWGPEPGGYLVRQLGLVQTATGRAIAAAIVVRPADGSFSSGTSMVTRAATWLRRHLDAVGTGGSAGAC